MLKVLNIHDEPALGEEITSGLRSSGYSVDTTRLGLAGVTRAMSHDYDVLVLGETLPDIGGPAIVSALRGVGVQTPVIMVSGTADIEQRIQGLRAGTDDYLAMPFSRAATPATPWRREQHHIRLVRRRALRGGRLVGLLRDERCSQRSGA